VIESEWRSPAREAASEWSVPSSRIEVGFDSIEPLSGASTDLAVFGRRLFAAETPLRKVR
jgi:hypothetical protein